MEALFTRLNEYGVVINPSECLFGFSSLDFLGRRISANSITLAPHKVQSMNDFPPPTSLRKLGELLCLSICTGGLFLVVLQLSSPSRMFSLPLILPRAFHFPEAALTALHAIKSALEDSTLLAHTSPEPAYCLMGDA